MDWEIIVDGGSTPSAVVEGTDGERKVRVWFPNGRGSLTGVRGIPEAQGTKFEKPTDDEIKTAHSVLKATSAP